MSEHDTSTDPSGAPFSAIDPALLRTQRTSIKWTRFPADVLPMFVAEMDFTLAPAVQQTLIERIQASDTGYLDAAGPLAEAFASFARDRWNWHVPHDHVHLATDVATGVVEALRVFLAQHKPGTGRLAIPVPAYPGFFEMLQELPFETVAIPLLEAEVLTDASGATAAAASGSTSIAPARLDLDAIERAFESGIDAFILCNPHNPHGTAHTVEELTRLAQLAAKHNVFVVSDEIHAPLTHAGETFAPFAPIAAEAGALAVTAASASKGWNLAGSKCSVIVAADERANELLQHLPPETTTRASILGLHANIAAYRDSRDWLDRAIAQAEANDALLAQLVAQHLPGVRHTRAQAGYLAWLDFRGAGLGDDPHTRILEEGRVAFGNGADFGPGGEGYVRVNLACAPDTLRAAISRVASILPAASQSTPR